LLLDLYFLGVVGLKTVYTHSALLGGRFDTLPPVDTPITIDGLLTLGVLVVTVAVHTHPTLLRCWFVALPELNAPSSVDGRLALVFLVLTETVSTHPCLMDSGFLTLPVVGTTSMVDCFLILGVDLGVVALLTHLVRHVFLNCQASVAQSVITDLLIVELAVGKLARLGTTLGESTHLSRHLFCDGSRTGQKNAINFFGQLPSSAR
jgi:hypothetical protein